MTDNSNLHIPEELLSHIINCFDSSSIEDVRTLARLSQVSKRLRRLAEPLLYRLFPGQKFVNPRKWLEAILAREGRAELVSGLKIDEFVRWRKSVVNEQQDQRLLHDEEDSAERKSEEGSDEEEEEEEEDLEALTPRELLLLPGEDSIGRLNDTYTPTLRDTIQTAKLKPKVRSQLLTAFEESLQRPGSTSTDLVLSLILLTCPNTTKISIKIPDTFEHSLIPLALTARNGPLQALSLTREGDRESLNRGQGALETLARLNILGRRKVESLFVTNDDLGGIMDPYHSDIFEGPWQHLTHIYLMSCAVPTPAMEILLKASPELKVLEVEMEKPLEHLGDLLRLYGQELERLAMNVKSKDIIELSVLRYETRKGLYGLGNLVGLTKLKELDVPEWALVNLGKNVNRGPEVRFGEMLPVNLLRLRISRCAFEIGGADFKQEVEKIRRDDRFANLIVVGM